MSGVNRNLLSGLDAKVTRDTEKATVLVLVHWANMSVPIFRAYQAARETPEGRSGVAKIASGGGR